MRYNSKKEEIYQLVNGDLTEKFLKHFFKMHVNYEFTGKERPMGNVTL